VSDLSEFHDRHAKETAPKPARVGDMDTRVPPTPKKMMEIVCASCGRTVRVPIPQFCHSCWLLYRQRLDKESVEASARIKKATEANKHKVVVWSREAGGES
jgi:hypothetical protein